MSSIGAKSQFHGASLAASVLALAFLLIPSGGPSDASSAQEPLPTFTKDVAPILFKNCAKCHQAGELASKTPLITYEKVQSRAESIKKKVLAREMPPWPVDPTRSLKFRNDPRLSQHDIDTIIAWVDAGAPKGDDADLPPVPRPEDGWTHPDNVKPDLVIALPGDVHLPAQGAIPYMRVLIKAPFSDDRWISAIQTRPSNLLVVHHMALTEVALPLGITPSAANELARQMGAPSTFFDSPAVTTPTNPSQPDILAIYTPGTTLEMYPDGIAKLLKGGQNLFVIFNIHYEVSGESETDRSSIGLWFAPHPPTHQLFRVSGAGEVVIANGEELLTDAPGIKAEGTHVVIPPIPPFADNYELIGITGYTEPVTIYQLQPHAHYRGNDFTYSVIYPDGREQTVLTIPEYDHRWQLAYDLQTPLKLPAGSKLVVVSHYDNSRKKMHNPGPDKFVYFRDMNQSSDEMFSPFMQYTIDDRMPGSVIPPQGTTENAALKIAEIVGCMQADATGEVLINHGSEPAISETEATSAAELKAAATKPLATREYKLIGAAVFRPAKFAGQKVAVKGILIGGSKIGINVTSLQSLAGGCVQ
jgi:hypothetical protein